MGALSFDIKGEATSQVDDVRIDTGSQILNFGSNPNIKGQNTSTLIIVGGVVIVAFLFFNMKKGRRR